MIFRVQPSVFRGVFTHETSENRFTATALENSEIGRKLTIYQFKRSYFPSSVLTQLGQVGNEWEIKLNLVQSGFYPCCNLEQEKQYAEVCCFSVVQHLGSKKPWVFSPKNHPGIVHRQKTQAHGGGVGVHRFIRCRGLAQKDHCNKLATSCKSSDIEKSTAANTPIAAIMEMYTPITHFVGSFLQQVIGILGHTMCLYFVF